MFSFFSLIFSAMNSSTYKISDRSFIHDSDNKKIYQEMLTNEVPKNNNLNRNDLSDKNILYYDENGCLRIDINKYETINPDYHFYTKPSYKFDLFFAKNPDYDYTVEGYILGDNTDLEKNITFTSITRGSKIN